MVVEEFKPPQPEQNAIQLGALPPEVRQEFIRGLGLPLGSQILSAQIKGQSLESQNAGIGKENASEKPLTMSHAETNTAKSEVLNSATASNQSPRNESLGGEEIVAQTESKSIASEGAVSAESVPKTSNATAETNALAVLPVPAQPAAYAVDSAAEQSELKQKLDKLQKQLEEQASEFAARQTQLEAEVTSRKQAFAEMQQQLTEKATNWNSQMEQFQSESKKRLEQSEAAGREALSLLEKRTAEVTELQILLKNQEKAFAETQKELAEVEKRLLSSKTDSKKKQPTKGKKPSKSNDGQ
jgi:hypothetical protein